MPAKLHMGDESKIQMPNAFSPVSVEKLRRAQGLVQTSTPVIGEQYRAVKLSAVVGESPLQVRTLFDPEHDDDDRALVDSLGGDGLRVPVLLVEVPNSVPQEYTILDGHRRVAALRHLSRETVKAVIVRQETLECDLITLTANVRKHLTPLEQARVVARLRERHALTAEVIAKKVGLSTRYLSELRALLDTDPTIQAALEGGGIKAKTALALGQAPRELQPQLVEIAAAQNLSEADAKRWVARIQDTGEAPEQAALALGIVSVPNESVERTTQSPESVSEKESSPTPPHRAKRDAALTAPAATTLLSSAFPELEARSVQALSELSATRATNAQVLKIAGLLALAGHEAERAVNAALPIVNNPGARKLVQVVDLLVDLRSLIGHGRCAPECASMLAALVKQAATLKQAVRAHTPTPKRSKKHGTPAPAG